MKAYKIITEGILAEYDQFAGDNPQFWTDQWMSQQIQKSLKKAEKGYLGTMSFLKKYLNKGQLTLEAGCGKGNLVLALTKRGFKTIGIDFSKKTIAEAKKIIPEINLICGNLEQLGFKEKSLDNYICLGVIEHYQNFDKLTDFFEEAKRVTKNVIFISVPYYSPIINHHLKRKKVNLNVHGKVFYQYYFSKEKFVGLLLSHGLIPINFNFYGTYISMQRYNQIFKYLWDNSILFRFLYKKSGRTLDILYGSQYGHMIGAWCKIA